MTKNENGAEQQGDVEELQGEVHALQWCDPYTAVHAGIASDMSCEHTPPRAPCWLRSQSMLDVDCRIMTRLL